MSRDQLARHIAFVLRCSGAATLSFMLASVIGLPHPVWAAMSGIVVSQDKLDETRNAALWRLAGTVTGVVVAVIVGSLLEMTGAGIAAQIALSVAVCAVLARRWAGLRVAMMTGPIIFLTHVPEGGQPEMPLAVAGFWRGAEVLLGGAIGALLHWAAEIIIRRMEAKPDAPVPPAPQME